MTPKFWQILFRKRREILFQWDFAVAALTGVLLAMLTPLDQLKSRYATILSTEIAVSVGLLGIILAGLTILIAYLHDDLFLLLDDTGLGLAEDYFPFSFAAALAILTAVAALFFLTVVPDDRSLWLRTSFGTTWFLFTWTLLTIFSLFRVVARYGHLRARDLKRRRSTQSAEPVDHDR